MSAHDVGTNLKQDTRPHIVTASKLATSTPDRNASDGSNGLNTIPPGKFLGTMAGPGLEAAYSLQSSVSYVSRPGRNCTDRHHAGCQQSYPTPPLETRRYHTNHLHSRRAAHRRTKTKSLTEPTHTEATTAAARNDCRLQ